VHGRAHETPASSGPLGALAAAFAAYDQPGSVTSVIRLAVDEVTGWSAS
jgi:hypothetical protein